MWRRRVWSVAAPHQHAASVLVAAQESAARESTAQTSVSRGNLARQQQLKWQQKYDIVSHKALTSDSPAPVRQRTSHSTGSKAQYNIISNAPNGGAVSTPGKPAKARTPTHTRDFSIISNRYTTAHEEKEALDKEVALRTAADRFWRTREFHPVQGVYYDDAVEEQVAQREAEALPAKAARAAERVPPTLRRAEGANYDIVSGALRPTDLAAEVVARAARPGRRQHRLEREAEIKGSRGAAAATAATRQSCRKASAARLAEHGKGYDLVSNRPFRGVGGVASAAAGAAAALLSSHAGVASGGASGNSGFDSFAVSGNLRPQRSPAPVGAGAGSMAALRTTAYDRLVAQRGR